MGKAAAGASSDREMGGGFNVLRLAASTAAAGGYTFALLRWAVPPGGMAAATPAFYSGVSLQLPAAVTAAYLAMCSFGPKLMDSRRPWACREAMLVYNAYQAVFNAACVAVLVLEVRRNGLHVFANPGGSQWRDKAQYSRIAAVIWLHYNNKYVELLDSVFMVLRKKTEQLSFLHVYHHCLLIWAWLYCLHLSGCVDTFFGAGCNAAIHVLMYSYYLLTALNVPCSWKRYLTVAQMAQFVACAGQSLNVLFTPDACPPSLPLTQLFVMVNMLFLFGRFYRKRYNAPPRKSE